MKIVKDWNLIRTLNCEEFIAGDNSLKNMLIMLELYLRPKRKQQSREMIFTLIPK